MAPVGARVCQTHVIVDLAPGSRGRLRRARRIKPDSRGTYQRLSADLLPNRPARTTRRAVLAAASVNAEPHVTDDLVCSSEEASDSWPDASDEESSDAGRSDMDETASTALGSFVSAFDNSESAGSRSSTPSPRAAAARRRSKRLAVPAQRHPAGRPRTPTRIQRLPQSQASPIVALVSEVDERDRVIESLKELVASLEARIEELEGRRVEADALAAEVRVLRSMSGFFRIGSLRERPADVAVLTGVPDYDKLQALADGLAVPDGWMRRGRLNRINTVAAALMHLRTARTFEELSCSFFGSTKNQSWLNRTINDVLT